MYVYTTKISTLPATCFYDNVFKLFQYNTTLVTFENPKMLPNFHVECDN